MSTSISKEWGAEDYGGLTPLHELVNTVLDNASCTLWLYAFSLSSLGSTQRADPAITGLITRVIRPA